jgi:hypothetical protein
MQVGLTINNFKGDSAKSEGRVAENFNTPRQIFGGYNRRFLIFKQNSKNEVSKQPFSLVKNDSKLVSFQ